MSQFSITLVDPRTGRTETLPLDPLTAVQDAIGFAQALFGLDSSSGSLGLYKNGMKLENSATLQGAGVVSGDMLAVQTPPAVARPRPVPAPAATGGLDFSNLLAAAPAPQPSSKQPIYYPGMSLDDAMRINPHPDAIITLLLSKEHLFKELRHHNPPLAAKLTNQPHAKAVEIWRESLVKGSIDSAVRRTTEYQKKTEMTKRLASNPNDAQAKEYFADIERKKKVEEQYFQMMEEYPESMGRVLMLYIPCKINGHEIQAFVDSGAQMTIMSEQYAREVGILDLVDKRFSGTAAGVGTGKILGKVHMAQLEISGVFFPCSITVMETPKDKNAQDMPFLFGLDMLKRHVCQIDLQAGCLKFPMAGVNVPFLHEKDLSEKQGGTRDFDADKANLELQEMLMKQFEEGKEGKGKMDES
jgi:DNA damage-inducible protein 1